MSNSDAACNESSSYNPIPPPTEESPRHRGFGELAPHLYPRGRGSSPVHSWEMALFSSPRPRTPPIMGAQGRTAFTLYRSPPPQWPSPGPGPSQGPSGSRSLGFHPVLVEGGGVAAAAGLRIGGNPSSGTKRGREGGVRSSGGGVGNVAQHCSVCNKGFGSSKALFGHMRSHPDRGWKGVHPPPAFRAEEEFADLHVAAEADEAGEDGMNFQVPDLNQPPPPDSN